MNEIVLEAEKREVNSKSLVKTLRATGKVPAVAYGDHEAPVALVLDGKSLQTVLQSERGRNALITLKIGSTTHPVLLKEIQRDPISRAIRHVDLHRISLKSKIETSVPVHVKGEAPGVKLSGGILEHVVREIRVRCLPAAIPAAIDVDVTALQINSGIKAKDLTVPADVELLIEKDSIIIHVVAPTILEEVAPVAAAAAPGTAAAEPEVIKKGKTEEGAESAAPAGDKKAAAAPAAADKKAEKK